ncbi:DMT family transporter [Emticicia sp. 17c]|uniref:DMT family transporter n=1 Tax=Emticicia sp. 17c TaxID=3127704 RepID=UPI00301E1029
MRLTYLKLIITVFFWGSNFAAGKIAVQSFGPYSTAFLRFSVGATILMIMLYNNEKKLPKLTVNQWKWAIVSGVLGVVLYNLSFFIGIQYMPTVRASLIVAFSPITITLGSAMFFGEKVTVLKWLGILVSIAGAMLVIVRGDFHNLLAQGTWGIGEWFILGAVISWTAYTLVGKLALKAMPALTLSAFSALVGCILLFFPALQSNIFERMAVAPWQAYLAVIYMGAAATALGFIWYYEAVRLIGVTKSAIIGNLTPVFAVLIAVSFLGEKLTIPTIIGGSLVLLGILLTNRK